MALSTDALSYDCWRALFLRDTTGGHQVRAIRFVANTRNGATDLFAETLGDEAFFRQILYGYFVFR